MPKSCGEMIDEALESVDRINAGLSEIRKDHEEILEGLKSMFENLDRIMYLLTQDAPDA